MEQRNQIVKWRICGGDGPEDCKPSGKYCNGYCHKQTYRPEFYLIDEPLSPAEKISALIDIIKEQQKTIAFYTSEDFPWSSESEYDNGATADEAFDSIAAKLKELGIE